MYDKINPCLYLFRAPCYKAIWSTPVWNGHIFGNQFIEHVFQLSAVIIDAIGGPPLLKCSSKQQSGKTRVWTCPRTFSHQASKLIQHIDSRANIKVSLAQCMLFLILWLLAPIFLFIHLLFIFKLFTLTGIHDIECSWSKTLFEYCLIQYERSCVGDGWREVIWSSEELVLLFTLNPIGSGIFSIKVETYHRACTSSKLRRFFKIYFKFRHVAQGIRTFNT